MKRKLNLALWIVAGILAVVFLVSSSTKLFVSKEKLAGLLLCRTCTRSSAAVLRPLELR